jgi:hypothetical protein
VDRIYALNNNQSYADFNMYMKYLYSPFKNCFLKIKFDKIKRTNRKTIKSLNASNSYGFDEISTKNLKNSIHIINSPVTHIFNQAVSPGTFPELLGYSIVIPLYKIPLFLLTSLSKILEKINYIRLYKHITENNILSIEQLVSGRTLLWKKLPVN